MRILITGGTGFIGRPLVHHFASLGYECIVQTRDISRARVCGLPADVRFVSADDFPAADAVVHLAGESVVGLWTPAKRRAILASRVEGTRRLVDSLRRAKVRPHTLLAASAVGFYGHRPGERLDEDSAPDPQDSFRAKVCRAWEAEAAAAADLGIRVVHLRIGNVMDPAGGFLRAVLPLFRLFGGVVLGESSAQLPWIPLTDCVALISFALANERWFGALNLTHPQSITRAEFASALATSMGRSCQLRLPEAWLRRGLGDFASALVDDQWVIPTRALQAGYEPSVPTWREYLRATFPHPATDDTCLPAPSV